MIGLVRAGLAVLVLACADMRAVTPPPPTPPLRAVLGDPLGVFQLTYYWVATEEDFTGLPDTDLFDRSCLPLAVVPAAFARSLTVEGTGRLTDGRLLNYAGPCECPLSPCFFEVDELHPWGVGVHDRALLPFRSVAVDPEVVPIGARLYVADLDGIFVPGDPPWGGFVHDGCVVADDQGGSIIGKHIDFFSALRPYYRMLDRALGLPTVMLYDGKHFCP